MVSIITHTDIIISTKKKEFGVTSLYEISNPRKLPDHEESSGFEVGSLNSSPTMVMENVDSTHYRVPAFISVW